MFLPEILYMAFIAAFFSFLIGIVLWCCFNKKLKVLQDNCINISTSSDINKDAICKCEHSVKRVNDQLQYMQSEMVNKKVSEHIKVQNSSSNKTIMGNRNGNVGGNNEQR